MYKSIPLYSVTFKVHKKSTVIHIEDQNLIHPKTARSRRSAVKEFSYKSERRMRILLEDTSDVWSVYIVTTYPNEFPLDGKKVKRDKEALLQWFRRQGIKNVFWGLEFQKRGAPHINFLIDGRVDKEKLSKAWFKIVGSGDERHLKLGTSIQAIRDKNKIATYCVGYQYKRSQKDVPEEFQNVGRFWGCTLKAQERSSVTFLYDSYNEMIEGIRPVVEHYEDKINKWSMGKEKAYTWEFRGNGWVMWDSSEFVNKFLESQGSV